MKHCETMTLLPLHPIPATCPILSLHWICKGKGSPRIFDLKVPQRNAQRPVTSTAEGMVASVLLLPQQPECLLVCSLSTHREGERGTEESGKIFVSRWDVESCLLFVLISQAFQDLDPFRMLEAWSGVGVCQGSGEQGRGCEGWKLSPLDPGSSWRYFLLCF